MSGRSRNTHWFGCMKCHTFFPTLERGLQHLMHSPQHTAETIDLIDRYSDTYRDAAARTLFAFQICSDVDREAAIAASKLHALQQASGKRDRHGFQPSEEEPDVRPSVDNSNRSQNVSNRSAMVNNLFMEPINVRVTVCPRPTHGEDMFMFAFARDRHTSVRKLLQAVDATYRERNGGGADVDLAALSSERLMMKLSKKNGAKIGGSVEGDGDVRDLSKVLGGGWFGEMEIG